MRAAWLLFLVVAHARVASAQALYIDTARVLPGDGPGVDCSRIVVKDGVISEVGPDVKRPPWSRAVDATTQVVTPGFIVPATAQFLLRSPQPPQQDVRVEVKADTKAADDVLSRDPGLELLREHGIVVVGVMPAGTDPGVPGLVAAMSTAGGPRAGAVISQEAALVIHVATHAPWRDAMVQAVEASREAAKKRARSKEKDAKVPVLDRALGDQLPVLLTAPTPAMLVAARDVLPLGRMDVTVLDGLDLWWEAATLKGLGARVLTYPALVRERGTRFPVNRAAVYERAGVPYAFLLTDDTPEAAGRLRDAAIEMIRTGCSREKVLAALTSEGATALGIADRAGSVAKGRRADLLFWSGDPFDPTSRLERVMIGGAFVERVPRVAAAP